jgi:hypothetical protein
MVQTGVSDSNYTQIVSGLSVGDRIIVPTVSGTTSTSSSSGGGGGLGGLGGGMGGMGGAGGPPGN